MSDETTEFLLITATHDGKKCILEKLRSLECGLYLTTINTVESYAILNPKFSNSTPIVLWHERLGHLDTSMLRRILHQSNGHSLTTGHISSHIDYNYLARTQGKFITRPSSLKFDYVTPQFLEHIQGDICGPINSTSGPFHYFMVLVDASTRCLMFSFFLLGTLLMLVYLNKLSNSTHIFLIILLKLFVWIMLVNFLLQLFMNIACPWV